MNLFVYYKLIRSEHPSLQIKVQVMQAELRAQFPTLRTELMKRPDTDATGHETWMEIYDLADIDINVFREALDQLALNANFPQPRRNEVFITV